MPQPDTQALVEQGITPPRPEDREKSVVKIKRLPSGNHISRRQVRLSTEKEAEIIKILGQIWEEWETNTSLLQSKLQRYNNIMEGVKESKNFPWTGSSNLHMPLIEIHITILHSVASTTMLEMDPIWYVKPIQDGVPEDVDTDIEKFLNAKSKIELKIDQVLSDIFWNVYRDGTSIGVLDWVEIYDKQYDAYRYETIEDFQNEFPDAATAGVSEEEYKDLGETITKEGEVCFAVEETLVTFRGPKLRIVELKDFIVTPTASPDTGYAMFVGDAFMERADYFRRMAKNDEWFKKDAVEKMLQKEGLIAAPDPVSQSQDQIEGIGRVRKTKADEYRCMQGILKYDLDEDGLEEKFLVTYDHKSKQLLRLERFPYWHNRCNWIIWRFKKRPKRLRGQSIPDQLIDINEEIDTQHNQRVDSRTITTVPSFLKLDTADFDPTRRDQRFFPGVTFKVSNFNQFKQLEIRQTDMGTSLQEEQNLMLIADTRTGASQLRSGREVARDPRSPAKKVALMLQQSNQRIDDHLRELRYGTEELGYQILELYYQYSPETIAYPKFNPDTQAYIKAEVKRAKLRNRNLILQVARSSVMDNPSQMVQKYMTIYSILSKEPLIAGNMIRRRELLYRLLTALRERDVEKIVPKVDVLLKEMMQQSGPEGVQTMMENIGATKPRESPEGSGAAKPMDTSGGSTVGEG